MNKYVEYIRNKLDYRTLLEQLAEELAELIQAVLKLIRAGGMNNNKTPKTYDEALKDLIEESQDLSLVLFVMNLSDDESVLGNPKLKRWAERLGYKE